MSQLLVNNLIRQLNEIHDGSKWFDQYFQEKIGGLSETEAFTKPHPFMHSVAEQVSHMLEWRKECMQRFLDKKYDLMHAPEDWKDNEQLQQTGWPALLEAFEQSRYDMIALIDGKDDAYLETPFQDTDYNYHYLIEGIIQHDIYHMGQIGIVVKMLNAEF